MNDESRRTGPTAADGGIESVSDGTEPEVLDRSGDEETDGDVAAATPEGKQEFLLEGVRRMPILCALQSGPASTSDLLAAVDMSRSTIHRAINSLKDYDIVEDVDGEYRLTSMGNILARETESFGRRAWTAFSLNQFLNSINGHADLIPVEHFADATVVRRKPRHPHATIHRIIKLFEQAESVRMLSTVISPVYVDVGYRQMMDGTSIEAVFDREVMDIMLSEYPEKAYETVTNGNFTLYAHDGLPFELFIFDGTVGMAAHNENGNAEILIQCEDSAAIEWAEDLYSEYLGEADPIEL